MSRLKSATLINGCVARSFLLIADKIKARTGGHFATIRRYVELDRTQRAKGTVRARRMSSQASCAGPLHSPEY
jgi:hypothetical protein